MLLIRNALYSRFFVFNVLLSSFLIFSQKFFENNFFSGGPFLWIILMTALPLGAAIYSRFQARLDPLLGYLFPLGLFYFLLSNVFIVIIPEPWNNFYFDPVSYKDMIKFGNIQIVLGVLVFFPIWLILGVMEMHLYRALSGEDRAIQWGCYFSGILGLFVGLFICTYFIPVPSPFWVGIVLIFLFLTYCTIPPLRLGWKIILTTMFVFFLLCRPDMYVRNPTKDNKYPVQFLPLEIKIDQWTRSNRLTIAQCKNDRFIGFYNSLFYWVSDYSYLSDKSHNMDYFVASLIPQGATVAVLGSGGGAQLNPVLDQEPRRVYAVDVVPDLVKSMKQLGVKPFQSQRVEPVVSDGRRFIKQSKEAFDFIYIPSVESGLLLNKSFFEAGLMLYTLEAANIYREKLKPNGIIAIAKATFLTEQSPFFKNYIATFKKAGFRVSSCITPKFSLMVATMDVETSARMEKALMGFQAAFPPKKVNVLDEQKVIRDDAPFNASVINSGRNFLHIWLVFVLIWAVVIGLLKSRFPVAGQPVFQPLLCGINYTLILLTFQLVLSFHFFNPLDAAILGNFIFLILIGFGILLYERKKLLLLLLLFCVAISLFFKINIFLQMLAIMALLSGGFFPYLIYCFRERLTTLLILDGVGAAFAGTLYLLVSITWGIHALLFLCFMVFIVTSCLILTVKKETEYFSGL